MRELALRLLIAGASSIITAAPCISAPDICVRSDELKVPFVYGRVVFSWKGRQEQPVPNANVEVRQEVDDEWQTVAKVTADESGHFHIKDIRPGRYEIYASAANLMHWSARLKVVKASPSQKIEKGIVMILEPLLPGACGDARTEKIKSK